MNILVLILLILLAVLPGIVGFLNYWLVHRITEAQTITQGRIKRWIACILLATSVVSVVAAFTTFHKDITTLRNAKVTESNHIAQVKQLSADNEGLRSQVCDLRAGMSDLLLAFANRPDMEISTRSNMLAVKKKMDVT